MTTVFGDTFYFLALQNPNDKAHSKALQFTSTGGMRLVTTSFVLLEFADAMSNISRRNKAAALVRDLYSNAHVSIVPCTQGLLLRGLSLYETRSDKAWSLTDCISFVVMKDRRIHDALTGDPHFKQAGFKVLL